MRLKLASRKSDLARWQAHMVARELAADAAKPECEFHFKSSLGDQNLDVPLASMGGKGVFTEDFHADLKNHKCDLVVHSWKDLPVEERAETEIVMTLPRADVRDLLLIPEPVWQTAQEQGVLQILTSSPRRAYNLRETLAALLPANVRIEFQDVRGNVPTRLGKMLDQKRALILAKAGLDRLLEAEGENFLEGGISLKKIIAQCRYMVLPIRINPPAAAQGALAVEILRSNGDLKKLMIRHNDAVTQRTAQHEREILASYGGGCHQKIGIAILERPYGKLTSLRGLTDSGEVLNQWSIDNAVKWTRADSEKSIFPLNAKQNSWFHRETIEANVPQDAEAYFVARADAWPENLKTSAKQIVWTAGLTTWQRLAAANVWVNGSSEGLGDEEDPRLKQLAGKDLEWVKLSHSEGTGDVVATYRLTAKSAAESPNLSGKTHFFWMSTTSFERARELYPLEIRDGHHACGPGSTYRHLNALKDLKNPVKVFAGLEQFLSETLP